MAPAFATQTARVRLRRMTSACSFFVHRVRAGYCQRRDLRFLPDERVPCVHTHAASASTSHCRGQSSRNDPAFHIVRRDAEESAADSRHILPMRLQLLDRNTFVENTPDF